MFGCTKKSCKKWVVTCKAWHVGGMSGGLTRSGGGGEESSPKGPFVIIGCRLSVGPSLMLWCALKASLSLAVCPALILWCALKIACPSPDV